MLIFVVGVIIGSINVITLNGYDLKIIKSEKSFINMFFNYFTYHFWYLFLIWLIGLVPIGFVFDYLILFFKSVIIGSTFSIILKIDGMIGVVNIVKIYLQDFIIILVMIYLSYNSIIFSMGGSKKFNYQDKGSYLNKLYFVIFMISLCSLIYSLAGNTIVIL